MMTVETKPVNFEEEMRSAFRVFDKDNSGTISGDEIAKVMKTFGENLSDEELKIMLQEVDKNGDGTIDCTCSSQSSCDIRFLESSG
jgi:calmodulin